MSLREDRYRYLLAPQGPASLLDLEAEDGPVEILGSSPEVTRKLHDRLAAWHGMLAPPPFGQLQPAPSPEANPAP
jgi:hypothetical protein